MPDEVRHSQALEAELIRDPELRAEQEVQNGLKQFELVEQMIQSFLDPERPFRFRLSHLQNLHRVALLGLSGYAGNWRPAGIEIQGSRHAPPEPFLIPQLIEELCDYVNDNWKIKSPLHLASYVMWKLNWIHPFTDGNGRTSRAASSAVVTRASSSVRLASRSWTMRVQVAASKSLKVPSLLEGAGATFSPLRPARARAFQNQRW